MSAVAVAILVGVLVAAGYAVYQLVKAKKAVTVGNVVTAVKAETSAVKADAVAAKNDIKKA